MEKRTPKIIKHSETEFELQILNQRGEAIISQKFSEIFMNLLVRESLRAISPTVKAINPKSKMGGL